MEQMVLMEQVAPMVRMALTVAMALMVLKVLTGLMVLMEQVALTGTTPSLLQALNLLAQIVLMVASKLRSVLTTMMMVLYKQARLIKLHTSVMVVMELTEQTAQTELMEQVALTEQTAQTEVPRPVPC